MQAGGDQKSGSSEEQAQGLTEHLAMEDEPIQQSSQKADVQEGAQEEGFGSDDSGFLLLEADSDQEVSAEVKHLVNLVDRFKVQRVSWEQHRLQTLSMLQQLSEYLQKVRDNTNIAGVVGNSTGILGGALVIGGLVASPFTAGTSLGLTFWGGAMSAAGGATAGGSKLTEMGLTGRTMKQVKNLLEEDELQTQELAKLWQEAKQLSQDISKQGDEEVAARMVMYAYTGLHAGYSTMQVAGSMSTLLLRGGSATGFGATLAQGLRFASGQADSATGVATTLSSMLSISQSMASGLLASLGLGLSIYGLQDILRNQQVSQKAAAVAEMHSSLQKQLEEVRVSFPAEVEELPEVDPKILDRDSAPPSSTELSGGSQHPAGEVAGKSAEGTKSSWSVSSWWKQGRQQASGQTGQQQQQAATGEQQQLLQSEQKQEQQQQQQPAGEGSQQTSKLAAVQQSLYSQSQNLYSKSGKMLKNGLSWFQKDGSTAAGEADQQAGQGAGRQEDGSTVAGEADQQAGQGAGRQVDGSTSAGESDQQTIAGSQQVELGFDS